MKKSTQLRLSVGSFAVAIALLGAPAFAQDSDEDENENDIIVTGTRLNVNPNLEGAQPVLSVTADQIASQGTVRIEDLTNQLPQVFAGQAGEVANGSTGTATLNLRGLGATRTLVLIDGRRLPYGSSKSSAANLDLIPTQLIERVEVLTGGASAVYGSDAVGGVANFILRNNFEGAEFDFQGGFQQTGNNNSFYEGVLNAGVQPTPDPITDGAEYYASAILGVNTGDGRGNVTLYANYERRESVTQINRVFSACTIGTSTDPISSFGGAGCAGSGNYRLFRSNSSSIIDPAGSPTNSTTGSDNEVNETISSLFQEANGQMVEYMGGPSQTYNYGQSNFFQRPSERFSIYARGHYEISDNVEVFADLSYVDVFSDAQIAETASFGTGKYSVNCDNPYFEGVAGNVRGQDITYYDLLGCTAADIANGTIVNNVTVSHRNVEGGPRNSRLENSAFRMIGGLRGDLADDNWAYEVFAQFSQTSDSSISTNDFSVAKLRQALLATRDPTGAIVCQDTSGGCVPYNIFQRNPDGTSRVTSAQTDFIQGIGLEVGKTEQFIMGANVQADLGEYGFQTPWAEEGVAFLIGVEYRQDSLESIPDDISQIPGGGFTGVGGATLPVAGQVTVHEIYTEMQFPLVTGKSFAEELILSGQFRFSDYSTNGNGVSNGYSANAFGVQLTWAPVEDIRFRGQFQRAVRAPNVIELYTGQDQGLPNLNSAGTNDNGVQLFDPCASNAPIASAAACSNTGVTAAQYGNVPDVLSGQTQSITGGNTMLTPESSDTWTFGAVFTPTFVPGFEMSIDYFNITVDDFIDAGIAAQTVLDNCLSTGEAAFCDLINRGLGGTLAGGAPGIGFQQTNLNIAELNTSGFDVQMHYAMDVGSYGDLRFDYVSTVLKANDFTPFPGGDAIDCAGFLNNGCIQPVNPKYRHRATMTWETQYDVDLSVTWRHFSSTNNDVVAENPEIDDQLPSVNYVDFAAYWKFDDTISLRAGALNVLNQIPPVSASSGAPLGNGNTFPTIYDTARTFFAGIKFRF